MLNTPNADRRRIGNASLRRPAYPSTCPMSLSISATSGRRFRRAERATSPSSRHTASESGMACALSGKPQASRASVKTLPSLDQMFPTVAGSRPSARRSSRSTMWRLSTSSHRDADMLGRREIRRLPFAALPTSLTRSVRVGSIGIAERRLCRILLDCDCGVEAAGPIKLLLLLVDSVCSAFGRWNVSTSLRNSSPGFPTTSARQPTLPSFLVLRVMLPMRALRSSINPLEVLHGRTWMGRKTLRNRSESKSPRLAMDG
jgi:hypothetical protein